MKKKKISPYLILTKYFNSLQCHFELLQSNINAAAAAESLPSCLTLCDPVDGSPPGSAIPGILQPRTLEWVAFPSPMHESEK